MLTRLLFLLLFASTVQAQVSVSVNRTQGASTLPLELVLKAEQSRPLPTPDFSVLEQDFTILDNNQLSLSNFKNGKTLYSGRWTLRLLPKRSGELRIPGIRVGSERSRSLLYLANEDATPTVAPTLFINASIEPDLGYSRSPFIVSVKLYYSAALTSAQLTEPVLDQVRTERLGPQLDYRETHGGRDYQVIEQRYALFPLSAGQYRLPAIEFTGAGPEQPEPYNARSEALEFEALALPADASARLTATEVHLNERWSRPLENLQVGDTLTRTLLIEAHNVPADWLPELTVDRQPGLSVYPLPARTSQHSEAGILLSRKELPIKLLLTEAGLLRLPALELSWWDSVRERQEYSRLAATTLEVAAFKATPTQTPLTASVAPEPDADRDMTVAHEPTAAPGGATGSTWLAWMWAFIALVCAGGWSLTRAKLKQLAVEPPEGSAVLHDSAGPLQSSLQNSPQSPLKQRDYLQEEATAFNRLCQACAANDADNSAQRLVQWARFRWPDQVIGDLADVETCAADPTLTYLLKDLEHRLYHVDDDDAWRGDLIIEQISRLRRRLRSKDNAAGPAN